MSKQYNPHEIEPHWQKIWEESKAFGAEQSSSKPAYFCLIEFPYPSGEGLHVGHPRSFTALDMLARKRRMQGYNVLYPIGFDAFGLPSENYAIKTGIHPAVTTAKNIANFTRQLKALGLSFDWDRAVTTTDPEYYRWTQWIFLQMFKHGLAYKDSIAINWCPSCKIGLANEEVVNGTCERCGGPVEKRQKEQWLLKITNYAERLIADLDQVDYLDKIKAQQINWIGKSEGAEITFPLTVDGHNLTVFTTRPDTLYGATFMVIAPEHPVVEMVKDKLANAAAVDAYCQQAARKSDLERTDLAKEKTGVVLEGVSAINPATGAVIPIYLADYVLASYGTGAIMAVPAHDQRDWEFAKKYHLPIIEVIAGGSDVQQAPYIDVDQGEMVNSGSFNGMSPRQCQHGMIAWLEERGIGKRQVQYKLRDWVFSRQRYWGEPIPLVHCQACAHVATESDNEGERLNPGWVALPDDQLPLTLPAVERYQPTENGDSPLAAIENFVSTTCPKCGGPARRETDVMPNWAGSNWYFLRYCDPHNQHELASQKALEYFMPVDWYNGGMEHTVLHLLYSRFVYKFLYDIGAVPKACGPEPYAKRTAHGLILGEGGEKMSKSRGNVVNPDEVVKEYGADTLRVYEMFMGPFDQAIPWDTKGLRGCRRFLDKTWNLFQRDFIETDSSEVATLLHKTIKKIGDDIESQAYNTAVSALMILVNTLADAPGMSRFAGETLLKLLLPLAPHIACALWQHVGNTSQLDQQAWPEYDESKLTSAQFEMVIQINSKVRAKVMAAADITQDAARQLALQQENIQKYIAGKEIINVIFVPRRLINLIVKE